MWLDSDFYLLDRADLGKLERTYIYLFSRPSNLGQGNSQI